MEQESAKGHLILEHIFEDIDLPKLQPNVARISALAYENFLGRYPSNIFFATLENQCLHKVVLRLSDLYYS